MEQKQLRQCPVGIQTFSEIREKDLLYIDKTEYIYEMVSSGKYYFLSRPRRFGKSLLTSTLRSYFEGRKELFEGLAMEKLEKEWTAYPVLHFDMSLARRVGEAELEQYIGYQLLPWEKIYGIEEPAIGNNNRLKNLIVRACEQTGQRVVVLVDEYDAPLLDVMHDERDLPLFRDVMRNFYSPLKACDPYLQFVFLTDITKFSQPSIFSELNNITSISMDESYGAICGITEEEICGQMSEYIEHLAVSLGCSCEEVLFNLKENYDGYHFIWPSQDVYNPFSLLNAFTKGKIDAYWFGSGTPTYLIEKLRKFGVAPSCIGGSKVLATSFDVPS